MKLVRVLMLLCAILVIVTNAQQRGRGGQPQGRGGQQRGGNQRGRGGRQQQRRPPGGGGAAPGRGGSGNAPAPQSPPAGANGQQQQQQQKAPPRVAGEIIPVGQFNNLREHVLDEHMRPHKNILLFFTNITCFECRKGLTEMAKLAHELQDTPKVGRVDCTHDFEACDLFVNHIEKSNQTYPYVMMLTQKASYVWDGPLNASQIKSEFLDDKKYAEFPQHGGRGYSTYQMLEDGKKLITEKMARQKKDRAAKEPWWIDTKFAELFAPTIGFMHYHAGLDFWRKQAKISAFCLMVLLPCAICIFHGVKVNIDARKEEKEEKKEERKDEKKLK